MARIRISWKSLATMYLVAATIIAVNGTSVAPDRRARHVTSDATTYHQNVRTFDRPSSNSLIFGNDETTLKAGKRVVHRLVGGHMKLEATTVSLFARGEKIPRNEDASDEIGDTDEATWDDGLLISSAGNGKEKSVPRSDDEDAEKTLSQQIKEGKYGLIQNEIYSSRPKRPGIISYSANPDVPKDNAKNLGGLDEEEIWLAENHVLVLRGGNFPDHEKDGAVNSAGSANDWSPIDDYKAPKRQVKIPPNPKVPPPFPVQLTENGPVRLIGVNGSLDEKSDDKGFSPGQGQFFAITKNGTLQSEDLTSQENTMKNTMGEDHDRKSKSGHVPARDSGVIGPFYPSLPPGAVFVMPPGNQSDYDEDDQSIYYPPPYSFYYKQDNSTPVPPGPLVPGIILPPPPDFFSGLEEKKTSAKNRSTKYTKRPATTSPPRITPTYYPPRKSSPKPYKVTSTSGNLSGKVSTTKFTSRGASFTMKPLSDIKYKTTTVRSIDKPSRPRATSTLVESTTPLIDQSTTPETSEFRTTRTNTVKTTAVTKNRWIPNISSNPVPLVTYYSSSTPSIVRPSLEVTPASVNVITEGKQRGSTHSASYYFYEEANDEANLVTTPNPSIYYRTTTEAPYYRLRDLVAQRQSPEDVKSYYETPIVSTERTPKHFKVESLQQIPKTSLSYHLDSSAPLANSVASSRAKGQRVLDKAGPSYYEDVTERSPPQVQSYYTTAKPPTFSAEPQNEYDVAAKPKPIYQYSYESAEYAKRKEHQQPDYYEPQNQRPSYYDDESPRNPTPEPFDEWQDVREEKQQYDYEEGESLPEQDIQPERENDDRYRNRLLYRTTTPRPAIVTTANPQQAYYTRQDDQLLDDVTREYFTNFGKKLRDGSVPSTTPIYTKTRLVVTERPDFAEVSSYLSNENYDRVERPVYETPRVRVHYGDQAQRPYSLQDDTRVNYKDPLPPVNTQSEWIPGFNPVQGNNPLLNYRQHHTEINSEDYDQRNSPVERLTPIKNYDRQSLSEGNSPTSFVPLANTREEDRDSYETARPVSLQGDLVVNYRDPRPPINPDAEYIDPSNLRANKNAEKASYFAYRLPGDGGHFYFLTPQAISQRQDENGGYLYSRPRGTRFSRQRRRGPRDS